MDKNYLKIKKKKSESEQFREPYAWQGKEKKYSNVKQKYQEKNWTKYSNPEFKQNKFCFLGIHVEILSVWISVLPKLSVLIWMRDTCDDEVKKEELHDEIPQ